MPSDEKFLAENFLAGEVPAYLKEMLIELTGHLLIESEKLALTLDEFITRAYSNGMSKETLRATLKRDLIEGGQVFGDFRKNFKSELKYGAEKTAKLEMREVFQVEVYDWLGVSDGKICPDCLARHNMQSKTYDEWERIGLPGAGATVCMDFCRCVLIPSGVIQKEVIQYRSKK